MTAELIFAIAATVVGLAYVGYPAALWMAAHLWRIEREPADPAGQDLPHVTLVIVALNEQSTIAARIENALAVSYPPDRYRVVVASDGSTDDTEALVRPYTSRGVVLKTFSASRGKAAVLREVVPEFGSDIAVLSDANTDLDPDAIQRLVRWFADSSVGVVCGQLTLVDPITGHNVEGTYWRVENWLKRHEAMLDAVLGANGAIYALRPAEARLLPPGTIVEDLVLPLLIRIVKGTRIVYDPEVRATEYTPEAIGSELGRRIRIGRGDTQALRLLWPLLNPRFGWTTFAFVGHKLLRWMSPFALGVALVANTMLPLNGWFGLTLAAQAVLYATAAAVVVRPEWGRLMPHVLRLVALFYIANLGLFLGFMQWCAGYRAATWQRTAR